MKKKLAFISSGESSYIFKEALEEEGGFHVSLLKNFAEAREELSKNKFDIIYLETFGIPSGDANDISIEDKSKSGSDINYLGAKLLTDVIREENSINKKTLVNVCVERRSCADPQQYLIKGANNVFIAHMQTYYDRIDIMKKQIAQKS